MAVWGIVDSVGNLQKAKGQDNKGTILYDALGMVFRFFKFLRRCRLTMEH